MHYDIESAKLLFAEAKKKNLNPKWLSEYGLFSVKIDKRLVNLFYSASVLNTQLASKLVTNKYLTRLILEEHGLPNIPYCLPESLKKAKIFLSENKKIIAKPTSGSHSRDIHLIEDVSDLESLDLSNSILEKYIDGTELRVLILKDEVVAVHEKEYKTPVNNPDLVVRVSYLKSEWPKEVCETALRAAEILDLSFATVDFLVTKNNFFILELNSAPGLRWFQKPSRGPAINIVSMLLDETISYFKNR